MKKYGKQKSQELILQRDLNKMILFSQVLITYYSLFIIIVTIIDIKDDNLELGTFTLILSITLLIVSVFILSINFKERSLKLQNCHIRLDKIEKEMEEKEDKGEDISQLKSEYYTILDLTENHSEYDNLKVEFSVRKEMNKIKIILKKKQYDNKPFTLDKWFMLGWYKLKRFLFISFFFLIPLILLSIILFIK